MAKTAKKVRKAKRWTRAGVERALASIALQLDTRFPAGEPEQRLKFLHARIAELEDRPAPLRQLLRFAYILTVLRLDARSGGLTPAQVRSLNALARALLATNGVNPGTSILGVLYAELQDADSLVAARAGRPLRAAWEHELAQYAGQRSAPWQEGQPALDSGRRLLALGQAALALETWRGLAAGGLTAEQLADWRLGGLDAACLSGRLADVAAFAAAAGPQAEWRRLFAAACAGRDPAALLRATAKGGAHYRAAAILEAKLFAWAGPSQLVAAEASPLKALARRPELSFHGERALFQLAAQVEAGYEANVPLAMRLAALGRALERLEGASASVALFLAWAAAGRFLARHKAFPLARLALGHYRGVCLAASGGASADVFGVVTDLLARPWFAGAGHEEAA